MSDKPAFGPVLATYACHPQESRGRRFAEPETANRSVFQRDRDRVVHCRSFRRMMHKTQVFVTTEGDHYRTRLTHSLEVAQIARSICRSLGLNEDLAEALALAHDLGHTPFGHAGEEALDAVMRDHGGFDHNVQTLRILTELETRYAAFDGLNLTWETLEGVVKHNGPIIDGPAGDGVPQAVKSYCRVQDLEVETYAGAEAQVASLADDIAYHSHDIDDGLRAGLFTLGDLAEAPLAGDAARDVLESFRGVEEDRLVQETVRRLIGRLVSDLTEESGLRLAAAGVASADDVRWHGAPVIAFSPAVGGANRELKVWLFENMYHHERIKEGRREARRVVETLFANFMDDPSRMPPPWTAHARERSDSGKARVIADYIAGMTDRFANEEYARMKAA